MSRTHNTAFSLSEANGYGLLAQWGLALLLFLPPFFRGLFFQQEQQWALFFAALIFAVTWLWKISRREVSMMQRPLDWLALGLVAAYLASSFSAANPRLALAEIIKYALYFMVFWLSSQLAGSRRDLKFFLNVLYLAGIGVAIAGFLTAVGLIEIKDGFLNGRIYSTMQYPNALASYLAAISFLGMGLWIQSLPLMTTARNINPAAKKFRRDILSFLYALGNFILILVYVGTGSRGGLVVFLPVLLIYLIGLSKECRLLAGGHLLITTALVLAVKTGLMAALIGLDPSKAWLWFAAGLLGAVLGQLLLQYLRTLKIDKKYLLAGTLMLLIILASGSWLRYGDQLSPGKLLTMGRGYNLQDRNVQERFLFWQDGMKIVKDYPVLGLGGGAFEETYRHYQSNNYSSTQIHNHYVQMWAETGTIGLLIFLGLWGCYKWTVWKIWRREKDQEIHLLIWSMFAAAINLGLHAFLDFDLSLSAIMILLFAIFGLTRGVERFRNGEVRAVEGKQFSAVKPYYLAGSLIISLALMVFMVMLWQGMSHAKLAATAYQAGKIPQSQAEFEKALALDPWNVDFRASLAMIYLKAGAEDKAVQVIEQVLTSAPYHQNAIKNGISIYLEIGNTEKALAYSNRAVANAPFDQTAWEGLTFRYFAVGYQAWTKGDMAAAIPMLEKAVAVPKQVEERILSVPQFFQANWDQGNPPLSVTPTISLYSGAANYILHDWPLAEKQLQTSFAAQTDQKLKGEAAMWLAVLNLKQGKDISQWITVGSPLIENFQNNARGMSKLPLAR